MGKIIFHQLYKHVVQIVEKFIKKVCVFSYLGAVVHL